jgi:presenilin-like A22 family membrane protease
MLVLLLEVCAIAGAICLIVGYSAHRRWIKRLGYALVGVSVVIVAFFVLLNVTTHVETVTGVIAR